MVAGHYERKQLLSRSRIVAWSHGARFHMARKLVEPHAGKRLLDYGCGDGTFLKQVSDLFPDATGADISRGQIEDCRARLPALSFIHTNEIDSQFDVVTCMEVLEHCLPDVVNRTISHLAKIVAQGGVIIISVPVEIGPTLIAKQAIRRVAGWRGIGDYKYTERYGWRELVKMLFATSRTAINRDIGADFYAHKGFNWRSLERQLGETFTIRCRLFTPFNLNLISSQVWFVCEKR